MKPIDIQNQIEQILESPDKEKTIYICRPVLNGDEIIDWAKSQGFTSTLPAEDMHVTIAYSKTKIDWNEIPDSFDDYENSNGDRHVEALGEKGDAIVLRFESKELENRWQELIDLGASWDWPDYKPHVTISYDGANIDLNSIEPYQGLIEFGPEKYEELDEDWKDNIEEVSESLKISGMEGIYKYSLSYMMDTAKVSEHVADLGFFSIRQNHNDYYVFDDAKDALVAFFGLEQTSDSHRCIVNGAYVTDAYRGNKIFEQFMLFLRTREGYNEIQIGQSQTAAMRNVLRNLSKGHFVLKWINKQTGDIQDYNSDTSENFYGIGSEPSDWEILLENYKTPYSTQRFRNKNKLIEVDMHYDLYFGDDHEE